MILEHSEVFPKSLAANQKGVIHDVVAASFFFFYLYGSYQCLTPHNNI